MQIFPNSLCVFTVRRAALHYTTFLVRNSVICLWPMVISFPNLNSRPNRQRFKKYPALVAREFMTISGDGVKHYQA
jgi:hypothetical protein